MPTETLLLTHRVHPLVLSALERHAAIIPNQTDVSLERNELLSRLGSATGVIVFPPDRVDEEFLNAAPLLRVVSSTAHGVDRIDVKLFAERGVTCMNVPDLSVSPTAELAVTLLLGLARRIQVGDRLVRSEGFTGWSPMSTGQGIAGSRIGLIGAGALGLAIAKRLIGLEATLCYADPRPLPKSVEKPLGLERMSLDGLLERCDAIFVSTPLSPETRELLGRSRLGRMKPGALLVNVARGSIVDERAVATLLEQDHLGGYAADVFAFEDVNGKALPPELLALTDRTLFTPHVGSAVTDVRYNIEMRAAENAISCLRGEHVAGTLEPRPALLAAAR
ncbi:MAG: phosphonate dehydrogenase [Planctomycetota bacterium]|jgi:phosphonate dehydrogenase